MPRPNFRLDLRGPGKETTLKSRLAITALVALSLLLAPTGAALATGSDKQSDKQHADKPKDDGPTSADDGQYGDSDDEGEDDTLIPGAPGGGSGGDASAPGGGAGSATIADSTATTAAPATGAGGPSAALTPGAGLTPGASLTPGAGLPGAPTPATTTPPTPGSPSAGGPSTVTPGGGPTGEESPAGDSAPSAGGVAGNVASGGNDDVAEAPAGADVRAGEQVAAAGGGSLAFTGFAAIPMLLLGMVVLAGGLLLRRSRSTT